MRKVLVIAAHPDDEVLGCGATMARLSAEGVAVAVAVLGEGLTARRGAPVTEEELAALHGQVRKAAAALGVGTAESFRFPDNRFDTVPLLDIVRSVEALIEKHRPDAIFTHHPGDLNVDHRITSEATLVATRSLPGQLVKDLYFFEVPSSTEWAFQRLEPVFRPSVFFDVGAYLEKKVAAMEVYDTEKRVAPHPRAPDSLRAIARRWGSVSGFAAAEAFELVRSLR